MHARHRMAACVFTAAAGLLAGVPAHAQIGVGGGSLLAEALYDELLPSGVGLTDFSYTGTGSTAGKIAFFNNGATAFRNESLAARPPWTATQSVHFAGSDVALIPAEVSSYNVSHLTAWGPMIQVPAFAIPVLIPYRRIGIGNLNLSDAQMCAVFSNKPGGQTWGQLLGTSDTTPIRVVYRTDGNSITEWLSRYLVAACPGSGFAVSGNFAAVVASALTGGIIPASWVSVAGGGAMTAALGTDGRIGYLPPDTVFTGSSNGVVARINGFLPTATTVQATLASQPLPQGGSPAASNPLAWVPAYVLPPTTTGYPIFGTTQLLLNQCYRDSAVQTKLKNFLSGFYGLASFNGGPVALPGTWRTAIASTFITSSSPLGIGHVNVCNGIGRPLSN